jgi:hypothetical protein
MTYGLTAPAAMTSLVAMLRAASALKGTAADGSDVQVKDGNEIAEPGALDVISVGWLGPDEDDTAADGSLAGEDYQAFRDRETYSIHCALATLDGDNVIPAGRARAFTLLGVIGQVIAADSSLQGTVMSAQLGSWSLRQDATNDGTRTRITFSVDCDAFTNR